MCGRTGLSLDKETLRCACSYKPKDTEEYIKPEWIDEHNDGKIYTPSYNIAPTDITPVLVSACKFKSKSKENDRILKPMMWGMIPPWHTGDLNNHGLSTNNCRLENIKNSKLYGPALRNGGRCVIVVEGFYEWQTKSNMKNKQPYYIYAPQEHNVEVDKSDTWSNKYDPLSGWKGIKLLHIAGIYNIWKNKETIIYSYSVLTMESNSTLDWLHHRMPVILTSHEQVEAWLDVNEVEPDMALSYLKPAKILSWHPVSTLVNNSRYKMDDCNKRIILKTEKATQKTLMSFFQQVDKRKCSDAADFASKRPKIE